MPDRTSTLEPRAIDPLSGRKGCSGTPPRHSYRSLHECGRGNPSKDAIDKEARARQSYGRSVAELYNIERPHSALGYRTAMEALAETMAHQPNRKIPEQTGPNGHSGELCIRY